MISLDIRTCIKTIVIAPDTTHIQTEQPQQRTTSLIYLLPISVCVWTDGSVSTNFGPGGAGVLSYATSARTQHHFPFLTVQFHLPSSQRSQSFVMPLDGASNITPLAHSYPGCLYKLPVLPRPPELCL